MTMRLVAGQILLIGNPGRTKCPVAPESTMVWLTSIVILDVLKRVSCFKEYIRLMEE